MGVQTQIDRISDEVSAQAQLITQIQSALEGKAAGGGSSGGASVETCTVEMTYTAGVIRTCYVSRYIDGAIVNSVESVGDTTATFTDVVKDSILAVFVSVDDPIIFDDPLSTNCTHFGAIDFSADMGVIYFYTVGT